MDAIPTDLLASLIKMSGNVRSCRQVSQLWLAVANGCVTCLRTPDENALEVFSQLRSIALTDLDPMKAREFASKATAAASKLDSIEIYCPSVYIELERLRHLWTEGLPGFTGLFRFESKGCQAWCMEGKWRHLILLESYKPLDVGDFSNLVTLEFTTPNTDYKEIAERAIMASSNLEKVLMVADRRSLDRRLTTLFFTCYLHGVQREPWGFHGWHAMVVKQPRLGVLLTNNFTFSALP